MRAGIIRLFVEESLEQGLDVACTSAHANHLINVMHLGDGAEILLFDGRNGEWRASLSRQGRSACVLHVLQRVRPQMDGPDVHYLFAPLKREHLDFMVQKATELGVAALRPVLTRRTQAPPMKLGHMRATAIEAAAQCGVLRVPQIFEPVSLDALLEAWDPARRIVYCDEEAPVTSPLVALRGLEPGPLAILIGPERGFDAGERTQLRGLGCVTPLSLGPRVMRADTAGIAALSLVNAVLGDWR